MKVPPPPPRGNRSAQETSARPSNHVRPPPVVPFDAATERALDLVVAALVPTLRAQLRDALAANLPHLQPRPRRERHGKRPGDDAPVDPLTREKARALLNQHFPRGGR